MRPTVYIETTIVSYLTARPSRDVIRMGNELLTRQWWDETRHGYDLYTSAIVIDEARRGDSAAAALRMQVLETLPLLDLPDSALALAGSISDGLRLPPRARADALHIAIAAVNGIEFLLTWNCRHLANANLTVIVAEICDNHGHVAPQIVTPQQLPES